MSHSTTVLVTGAEGLVGRHVVRALFDTDTCNVIAVSRRSALPNQERLIWEYADLRQPSEVLALARSRPDVIVHAAAVIPRTLDDAEAAQANRAIDDNTFALARQLGASLIYMSSQSVYEDCAPPWAESLEVHPKSVYAAEKYRSEMEIKALRLPSATLRISSPYSASDVGRQGVLYHFAREAVAGRPLTVAGNGMRAQDFVHGADVARAVVSVIRHLQTAQTGLQVDTFNIAAGHPVSMTDLAELVVRCCGSGEVVHQGGVETKPHFKAEMPITRAMQVLRWQPRVNLGVGLEQLIRHMRGDNEDWLVI